MEFLDKLLNLIEAGANLSPSQLLGLVLLVLVGLGLSAFIYDRKKQAKEDDNTAKMLAAITRMADRQEKSDEEIIKDLRGQLAELKHDLIEAQKQVSSLELKVTQQAGDLKLITQDRERLETLNRQLEKHLEEQTEIARRAVETLDEMRKAAERREVKITELVEANERLKAEIASLKTDFEAQLATVTAERDELKNKLSAITGQMTRLRNRITELEKENKAVEKEGKAA